MCIVTIYDKTILDNQQMNKITCLAFFNIFVRVPGTCATALGANYLLSHFEGMLLPIVNVLQPESQWQGYVWSPPLVLIPATAASASEVEPHLGE